MTVVYHFTDTLRLPWILEAGELRPNPTCIAGFPPDFLWATTAEAGDRTSSAAAPAVLKHWRDGELQLVRFVLKAADFGDWEEAARLSNWSVEQIKALKKAARRFGEPNTGNWRSRSGPLEISNALRVEAKSYRGGRWVPLDANRDSCITSESNPHFRGIAIGNQVYCAIRNSTLLGFSYQPVHRSAVH
jgi:hypothetical protein